MTIYFTIVLMALVAGALILWPLWQRTADRPLGQGRERLVDTAHLVDERDRIAVQMSELDIACAEGKIDAGTCEAEKAALAVRGERLLTQLQHSRSLGRDVSASYVARSYPWLGLVCGIAFVLTTTALSIELGGQGLDPTVSPHADGTIPLPTDPEIEGQRVDEGGEESESLQPPVFGADGQPDIAAMVARLEARVDEPDATLDDIMMLARSYRVLGRDEEVGELYERAVRLAPNDPEVLIATGWFLSSSDDEATRQRGDALIDKLLQASPDNPEAMWLKSLGLVRRHRIDEAVVLLERLEPLVAGNPKARQAVASLLDRLAQSAAAPAMVPNEN